MAKSELEICGECMFWKFEHEITVAEGEDRKLGTCSNSLRRKDCFANDPFVSVIFAETFSCHFFYKKVLRKRKIKIIYK